MTEEYGPSTYGDRIAEIYDTAYADLPTEQTVERLAELAGAGPVLELAVGTGRIALPLALRGLGVKLYPVDIRYAWPSELDLMARLAGLTLRERWGGWMREPFTSDSDRHVSVYGRPLAA